MIRINEAYDPFKDMHKSPNGKYTDGWGNSFDKPNKDKSAMIPYKDLKFQYDYKYQQLNAYYNGEDAGVMNLSLGDWLDGPEYHIERAYNGGLK